MKIALVVMLALACGSCTTHISREGRYLTLVCMFPCFLRIANGEATINANAKVIEAEVRKEKR